MKALIRIHVSDAGIDDINGKYDLFKFDVKTSLNPKTKNIEQTFMYRHISNTTKYEYGIYLTKLPELGCNDLTWVIGRIDKKLGEPILFYYGKQIKGNIPPTVGWRRIGGISPNPTLKIETINLIKNKSVKHASLQIYFFI